VNPLALAGAIVVLNFHLDGKPTANGVNLPEPPAPFRWVVCIREYEAPAVRCYAVDPNTGEIRFTDYNLK